MAKKRKKKTSVGIKLISILLIGFSIAMLSGVLKDIYDVFSLQKQAALVEKQLQELKEENFIDKTIIEKNYPEKDFHTMYIGEIVEILVKE